MPGSPARELSRLVQLQRDKLQALESRLLGCEAEMQDCEGSAGEVNEVSENLIKGKRLPTRICFQKTSNVSKSIKVNSAACGRSKCLDWSLPVYMHFFHLLSSSKLKSISKDATFLAS